MTMTRLYPADYRIRAIPPILGPQSDSFSTGSALQNLPNQANTSGTWFSVNDPIAIPFYLNEPVTVLQLGWDNGTAPGDNVDVGIYDTSWNRLVSTGSTATGAATSTPAFADVTDTTLARGWYYIAMSRDSVTANRLGNIAVNSNPLLKLCGVQDSATNAFPLPDPLTNMAAAATAIHIPGMYIALRASPL